MDLTTHWTGILSFVCFAVAYGAAVGEERLQVRKSVPGLAAAGVMWILVGVGGAQLGASETVATAARHTILDFAELLLFLIPAMTFVNTLNDGWPGTPEVVQLSQ